MCEKSRTNSIELSEAIDSIYRYCEHVDECYIYLAYVSSNEGSGHTEFHALPESAKLTQ